MPFSKYRLIRTSSKGEMPGLSKLTAAKMLEQLRKCPRSENDKYEAENTKTRKRYDMAALERLIARQGG
jgi:hypothetical protein